MSHIYIACIILIILIVWVMFQKSLDSKYIPEGFQKSTYPYEDGYEQTIITYNIQKFPWSLKTFENIRSLLEKYSIILLQECFDESYGSLEQYFPQYYISRGTLKGWNLCNSGLAILSKFPILETEFIQYKNYNPLTFEYFSEKGFLSVLIRLRGKHIRIINTHLQSADFDRYDYNAFLQMEELFDYLKTIDSSTPYIIGGDFNIDIQDFKKKYSYPYTEPIMYYPCHPTIYINFTTSHTRPTCKKGYDGMIFDYFIVSEQIVLTEPKVINYPYSDHNPVETTFKFN